MAKKLKNNGFSLTEVLMAAGILCIGIMLVATMFPVGIYLTTVASERTMASIVADEAFAKIQLYGLENTSLDCFEYSDAASMDSDEYSYPPVDPCSAIRQYYWSALCKKLSSNEYLVTVFVARKTSPSLQYPVFYGKGDAKASRPILSGTITAAIQTDPNKISVNDEYRKPTGEKKLFPPAVIIDNATGRLYRVIEEQDVSGKHIITLDRRWDKDTDDPTDIQFMVPPVSGTKIIGKNPDIEVFQRIMRF